METWSKDGVMELLEDFLMQAFPASFLVLPGISAL